MNAPSSSRLAKTGLFAVLFGFGVAKTACFYAFDDHPATSLDASLAGDAAQDAPVREDASGRVCGPDRPCVDGFVCTYADRTCGATGDGVCMAKPEKCEAPTGAKYCGCDFKLYPSLCELARAGTDLSERTCPLVDAGLLPCGYVFCPPEMYCRMTNNCTADAGCALQRYECVPFPSGCGDDKCACIKPRECDGGSCLTGDSDGGSPIQFICP